MSAYHSPLWARFYDLWIDTLFDPETPGEDIAVFLDQFRHVETKADEIVGPCSLVILEVGTGSGRVIRELYQKIYNRYTHGDSTTQNQPRYCLIGTEPSAPMLQKAKMLWQEFQCRNFSDPNVGPLEDHFEVSWAQASATDFSKVLSLADCERKGFDRSENPEEDIVQATKVDLLIFAAGGASHVASLGDVKLFLAQVSQSLRSGNRAVISVLSEFFSPGDLPATNPDLKQKVRAQADKQQVERVQEEPTRLVDPTDESKVFVKYPTQSVWDKEMKVRTDRFRLAIEDRDGTELDAEELEWQMRVVDLVEWEVLIKEAGLQLLEIVFGEIQVWLVLEVAQQGIRDS